MINIEVRDKNKIITLTKAGSAPIKSRTGATMFFWHPVELLCAALGACAGGALSDYCRFHDIDPAVFESFAVTKADNEYIMTLQHPSDIPEDDLKHIEMRLTGCEVARTLAKDNKVTLEFIKNSIPTEKLKKMDISKGGCCG